MYATLQKNLKMQKQFSKEVNKTSSGVKALGKAKANPLIQAKDKASAILNKVKNGLKAVGNTSVKAVVAVKDVATAGLNKIKSALGTLAKGATIAVGIAGAGASLLAGGAVSEGAKLEQSIGGVETLFKGDAGKVKANADMAFKTAGLSANAYMETVTSFSASLLNSLGGDTAKSAQVADMAIIDMADNANKFGTDMESIQNAYQGFAKQNYTMLDNLKLGYGGTKEEMERLLADASKLTGVKYDISNLSDVYNAIHAVQENLGVTGTTAKEASTTFAGSLSSMKASWSNLLGNMATGGDVTGSMEQLIDSASTFLFDNAIPMIGRVFSSLPSAISTGLTKAKPKVREALISLFPADMSGEVGATFDNITGMIGKAVGTIKNVVKAIIPVFTNIVSTMAPVVEEIGGMIGRVASVVGDTLGSAFGDGGGFIETFASIISGAIPIVESILTGLIQAVGYVMPVVQSLGAIFADVFPSILTVVNKVISTLLPIIQRLMSVIQRMMPIIKAVIEAVVVVFSTAWDIVAPILDIAMSIFEAVFSVVEAVFPAIRDTIEAVWEVLEPVFSSIAEGLETVGNAISGVGDFVGDGLDTIGSWFGFAYGKDRVPYDNYPAVLHQGEKVLTRNQADQYDRAMGTRGVQLGVTRTEAPQSTASTSTGGTNVHIEKLADTVVIEKEADVDKVVEGMVTKFKQLVPNMP